MDRGAQQALIELNNGRKTDLIIGGPGYSVVTEVILAEYKARPIRHRKTTRAGWTPNWMVQRGDYFYIVDETNPMLSCFKFDHQADEFELKAMASCSSGVVHIAINEEETRLVGSAYGEGTIDIWDIGNDPGQLKLLKTINLHDYQRILKEKQPAAHPHQAVLDPTGRYFVVNDLGSNSIFVLDSKDDKFAVTDHISVLPPGRGPRHGAFYPSEKKAFLEFQKLFYLVVCELSNNLIIYDVAYSIDGLQFTLNKIISTYGPDLPPKNLATAAAGALLLIPRGSAWSGVADVYISNRASGYPTDHVVHFVFNGNNRGSVEFWGSTNTGGTRPRAIAASISGSCIFVANQEGETGLAAIRRDRETGVLNPILIMEVERAIFGDPEEKDSGPQFVMEFVKEGCK